MAAEKQKPRKKQVKKNTPSVDKPAADEQLSVPDSWLNKRQVCESLGISSTGFDKWRVEPVQRIGNRAYYDIRTIVDNRVEAALKRQQVQAPRELDIDPVGEQARLAKEKADAQALKNAVTRGELIPAEVAGGLFGKIAAEMAAALDALPGQIKRRVPSLTATDLDHIKREIVRAQNGAAEVHRYLDEFVDDIDSTADTGD